MVDEPILIRLRQPWRHAAEALLVAIRSGVRRIAMEGPYGCGRDRVIAAAVAACSSRALIVCHNESMARMVHEAFHEVAPFRQVSDAGSGADIEIATFADVSCSMSMVPLSAYDMVVLGERFPGNSLDAERIAARVKAVADTVLIDAMAPGSTVPVDVVVRAVTSRLPPAARAHLEFA